MYDIYILVFHHFSPSLNIARYVNWIVLSIKSGGVNPRLFVLKYIKVDWYVLGLENEHGRY